MKRILTFIIALVISVLGLNAQNFDVIDSERQGDRNYHYGPVDCVVNNTEILSSVLEDEVKIGPYCRVRPGSRLGRHRRSQNQFFICHIWNPP